MTNTLGIMLEILSHYPWTRLSVRIIGVIKRQFFHMVGYVFDNSNLSQEIFAINTWGAVICSLGHGRKHMLTILRTIWRPGLTTAEQAGDYVLKMVLKADFLLWQLLATIFFQKKSVK